MISLNETERRFCADVCGLPSMRREGTRKMHVWLQGCDSWPADDEPTTFLQPFELIAAVKRRFPA